MKILCQILSILLVIVAVSGCTANVNADINANSGNSSSQSESSENVSSELSSDDLSSLWDDVQLEVEGNSSTSSNAASNPNSGNESENNTSESENTSDPENNAPDAEPEDPNAPTVYLEAVRDGDTVTVKFMVKNNPGVAAYSVKVDYDKEKVTPKTITAGITKPVVSNLQQPNATLHGSVTAVYANLNGTKENGEMFNITFNIKDGASGNTEFKIVASEGDFVAPDYAAILFNQQNTSISLS